jgi:hypothetical protein
MSWANVVRMMGWMAWMDWKLAAVWQLYAHEISATEIQMLEVMHDASDCG